MGLFDKLLGGNLFQGVGDIIDQFKLSPEEKQRFKLEMESMLMQKEQQLEETYRQELTSRADIIKAEMAQGDAYTKRARPTIIYGGLIFIFIVYVLVPVLAYLSGTPATEMPQIKLPPEFWWAWGTVVSVYGAGRSAEKIGVQNKLTNLMTGSVAYKIPPNPAKG